MKIDKFLIILFMTMFVSEAVAGVRFVSSAYTGGSGNVRDFGHVEIVGEITDMDLAILPAAIDQFNQQRTTKWGQLLVFLKSNGGDVRTAIEIGKVLRKHSAYVVVDKGSECSSACIFILAGGVVRNVLLGASLGLHRPFFEKKLFAGLNAENASKLYASLIEICQKYLSDMGINGDLFSEMLDIPSYKVRYVDNDYAVKVGLHGTDPAYQEWKRARDELENGKNIMHLRDLFTDCLNSGIDSVICSNRYGYGFK